MGKRPEQNSMNQTLSTLAAATPRPRPARLDRLGPAALIWVLLLALGAVWACDDGDDGDGNGINDDLASGFADGPDSVDGPGDDGQPPVGGGDTDVTPSGSDAGTARDSASIPNIPLDSIPIPAAISAPMPEIDTARSPACDGYPWIAAVRGWVLGNQGHPLAGVKSQLCIHVAPNSTYLCLMPATTGDDGIYTIDVPADSRCIEQVAIRVLLPQTRRAAVYCEIDLTDSALTDEGIVRIDEPVVLFDTQPATTLPPEGDATATRTVEFADGLSLEVEPVRFHGTGDSYAGLGSFRVDVETRGLCALDGVEPFDGVYAFSPEGDVTGAGFPLSIPNSTHLDPGSRVELYALGGLVYRLADGTAVPEAEWRQFGHGTVSSDGAAIESDPGDGLPFLTWLGYRAP